VFAVLCNDSCITSASILILFFVISITVFIPVFGVADFQFRFRLTEISLVQASTPGRLVYLVGLYTSIMLSWIMRTCIGQRNGIEERKREWPISASCCVIVIAAVPSGGRK